MAVGMTLALPGVSFDVGGAVPHHNCAEPHLFSLRGYKRKSRHRE